MPQPLKPFPDGNRLLALIFQWADADTTPDSDRRLLMACSSQSAEACSAFLRCTRLPGSQGTTPSGWAVNRVGTRVGQCAIVHRLVVKIGQQTTGKGSSCDLRK
jgi:hypothetical protein